MLLKLVKAVLLLLCLAMLLIIALPFLAGMMVGLMCKGQNLRMIKPLAQDMRFQQLLRRSKRFAH